MKILITGRNGQLGNELAKILKEGRSELGVIPACYQNAQVTGVDLDELDIADQEAVSRFFEGNPFDLLKTAPP